VGGFDEERGFGRGGGEGRDWGRTFILHIGLLLPMSMYSWDMSEWSIVSGELVRGWRVRGRFEVGQWSVMVEA
jgi:hypothetical protein